MTNTKTFAPSCLVGKISNLIFRLCSTFLSGDRSNPIYLSAKCECRRWFNRFLSLFFANYNTCLGKCVLYHRHYCCCVPNFQGRLNCWPCNKQFYYVLKNKMWHKYKALTINVQKKEFVFTGPSSHCVWASGAAVWRGNRALHRCPSLCSAQYWTHPPHQYKESRTSTEGWNTGFSNKKMKLKY